MSTTEAVIQQALDLPESDRFLVVEALMRSLDDEAASLGHADDPGFGEELNRRSDEAMDRSVERRFVD